MTPSRSPHLVGPCDEAADELLRLGCLNYGNDSADRVATARALVVADPTLASWSLHTAAACGDVDAVRRLLTDVDAEGGPFGWPPLLYLTYSRLGVGDPVGVARLLLSAGADANARFLWEGLEPPFTALTGVFGHGEQAAPPHPQELSLARVLLDAGADPNDGQTIYNRGLGDIAVDDTDWLELLLEFGFDDASLRAEALHHAAEAGLPRRVDVLLAAGTDPNRGGDHPAFGGRRPYEGAVAHGNLAIAEALAAAGADTSGVDALTHVIGHLLAADSRPGGPAAGADSEAGGSEELVERARAARPDLIGLAVELDRPEAVRRLVAAGWDVDHRTHATALHQAAWRDDRAMVDLLLDLGADPTILDAEHRSPAAGWAHHGGHEALARYLEARRILHGTAFMTLSTNGDRPWATPVWFAHERLERFVWMSKPGARHSRNITAHPDVGIVVFDSSVQPGEGTAAYFEATARELTGTRDEALVLVAQRAARHGLPPWTTEQVTGEARHRLYEARVTAAWVLDDHDERLEVR